MIEVGKKKNIYIYIYTRTTIIISDKSIRYIETIPSLPTHIHTNPHYISDACIKSPWLISFFFLFSCVPFVDSVTQFPLSLLGLTGKSGRQGGREGGRMKEGGREGGMKEGWMEGGREGEWVYWLLRVTPLCCHHKIGCRRTLSNLSWVNLYVSEYVCQKGWQVSK